MNIKRFIPTHQALKKDTPVFINGLPFLTCYDLPPCTCSSGGCSRKKVRFIDDEGNESDGCNGSQVEVCLQLLCCCDIYEAHINAETPVVLGSPLFITETNELTTASNDNYWGTVVGFGDDGGHRISENRWLQEGETGTGLVYIRVTCGGNAEMNPPIATKTMFRDEKWVVVVYNALTGDELNVIDPVHDDATCEDTETND